MATPAQMTDEDKILLDAPKDGNANTQNQTSGQDDLGPNFENLEKSRPELVNALRELVKKYREEGIHARRLEIKRIKQARLFWQDIQYPVWNEKENSWQPYNAGTAQDDESLEEMPRFQFTTNFFKAFGLSFIAALTQSIPSVPIFPTSTRVQEEITAAKAATDVVDLIERNNNPQEILTEIGYLCWTDGKVGGYVRFVADGERFGWKDYPTYGTEDKELQPALHACQNCGATAPATPESQTQGMNCPQCLQPMGADTFQPSVTAAVPVQIESQRIAKGQEVISIVGGLELNTPIYTNKQHEMPYLQWNMELHKARLKAAYPHIKDKLESSQPQGAEEIYARTARLVVTQNSSSQQPGDALQNLPTFSRTWLRPWAFAEVEDEKVRAELAKMFPDGCYCAFAGEAYCEARSESMDDRWRVMHPLPGDGQSRPGVGDSLISPQERYNILTNIEAEHLEFGIPPIYADPAVLDFDSLANQVVEPAAHYPARPRTGRALSDSFFQPAASQVPPELQALKNELMGAVSQFLSGMFPAVFGGEMNDNKTASGYAMARDQAMGRLGLIWRRIKSFYCEIVFLGVECFRKNRPEDVEIPYLGENNEFKSKFIQLADLKGNIQVQPEEDETYPELRSQIRGALQQLMEAAAGGNEVVAKTLTEPANLGYIKNALGLPELTIPGEDARTQQLREIEELLASPPTVTPPPVYPGQPLGAVGPDGQPLQPQVSATVPVDEMLDDHDVHFEEIKRWATSDEGQTAKKENPAGFANVKAHAQAHQQVLQQNSGNQQKGPSESISFKDLPPDGQTQMAAQAGIKLNPMQLIAKQEQDRADKANELQQKLKGGGGKNE